MKNLLPWLLAAIGLTLPPGPLRAQGSATSPVNPTPVGKYASTLSGDWGGLRDRLFDRGLDLSLAYTGESAANPVGGREQGVRYAPQINTGAAPPPSRAGAF